MALVYDLDGILAQITKNREQQPYNVQRDTMVEAMYTASPINFGSFLKYELECDLEELTFASNVDQMQRQTRVERGNNNPLANSTNAMMARKRVAVHVFEAASAQSPKFQFTKETVNSSAPPSALSAAMKQKQVQKAPAENVSKNINIKIFLPTKEIIKISVGEKTSIDEVIKMTLQQYEAECNKDKDKKQMRINLNPSAYTLRFAEDDGTLDEDMPPLVKTQEIGQFKGCTVFRLTPDTSIKIVGSSTNKTGAVPPMPLFKVMLPKDNGFVSVAFQRETTLRTVLDVVCKKTTVLPDNCHFEYIQVPPNMKTGELSLDQTLGSIGVNQLRLVENEDSSTKRHQRNRSADFRRTGSALIQQGGAMLSKIKKTESSTNLVEQKSEVGDAPKQITKRLGPMFFFTPQTAIKFHEYQVIKLKNFGVRQERTMGIDDKRITNNIPESKTKGEKTKRPERKITEVVKASLGNKQNTFSIDFTDGSNYKYESVQAEEIVAKITYLLQMQGEEKQRIDRVKSVA